MKPHELRYGNLVYRIFDSPKHPEDFEVVKIGAINGIENTYCCSDDCIGNLDELEPIKLTEEYLLKLGFKKGSYKKFWGIEFFKNGISICLEDNEFRFYRSTNRAYTIYDYVNEIQNLYYSLSGEELEYKTF